MVQILTPDRNGRLDDVVLGYDTLAEARAGLTEMGAIIGRAANRIAGARFELGGRGYDHNFVLDKGGAFSEPAFAARLSEPASGRVMEVWTTEPGVQLYTGNFLQEGGPQVKYVGKGGRPMLHRGALCLETQHFPDAVHHPNFPSTILNPGERYRSTTVFKFR